MPDGTTVVSSGGVVILPVDVAINGVDPIDGFLCSLTTGKNLNMKHEPIYDILKYKIMLINQVISWY